MHSFHSFMDLPEISSLVSKFLTGSDLARCMRVCHQWQFIIRPILYSGKVEFYSSGSPHQPSREIASRHGHFMQRLKCLGVIGQDHLSIPSITHLTKLVVMRGNDGQVFKATYWDAIVALVRRNPHLTELRLMSGLWPPAPPSDDDLGPAARLKERRTPTRDHLWDAVANHPNLKHLTIMNTRWVWVQPYTTSFWHATRVPVPRLLLALSKGLSTIHLSSRGTLAQAQDVSPRRVPAHVGKIRPARTTSILDSLLSSGTTPLANVFERERM